MSNTSKYLIRGFIYLIIGIVLAHFIFSIIPWGVGSEKEWPFLKILYVTVWVIGVIGAIIFILGDLGEHETEEKYTERIKNMPRISKLWLIPIILIILLLSSIGWIGSITSLYNASVVYNKQYERATQGLAGFYDGLWKTYLQKEKITNVNRETFIQVTKIIMENRKDGQSVTWKWLQENQQIPYSEFTKFYSDLSSFIQTKREDYYALEVQRQNIAAAHNMLIDTFPNNVYNMVIGRRHIQFKYGILSDSTNQVFSTGVENVK